MYIMHADSVYETTYAFTCSRYSSYFANYQHLQSLSVLLQGAEVTYVSSFINSVAPVLAVLSIVWQQY
jgi:uncharacterized membrane protein YfbV (UPF0208 family)